jgi:hypothetical protein
MASTVFKAVDNQNAAKEKFKIVLNRLAERPARVTIRGTKGGDKRER